MKQSKVSTQYSFWIRPTRSLPPFLSAVVVLIGLVALLGWVAGVTSTGLVPGPPTMKLNTALCFVFMGTGLGLEYWLRGYPTVSRILSVGLASGVVLIAGLTLIQYGSGLNLGIDNLLQLNTLRNPDWSLRMSPNAALAFLLSGLALALSKNRPLNPNAVQFLAFGSGAIALLGLVGHLYGNVNFFLGGPYTGMALYTTVTFLLINVGLLFSHPERGPMRYLSGSSTASLIAQRLLPLGIAVPLLIGGLMTMGYRLNLFSAEAANALQGVLDIIVFTSLIGWSIVDIERLDHRRQQAEQTLQNSELKFRAVFSQSFQYIALIRIDGILIEANQRLQAFVASIGKEVVGCSLWDLALWNTDDPAHFKQAFEQALRGEMVRFESTITLPDRFETVTHDITLNAIKNEFGHTLFLMLEAHDISDRKRNEESLRRYERILSATTDAIALVDRNYRYLAVNQAYLNWYQKTYTEILGHTVMDLLGPEQVERTIKPHFEACLAGETIQYEHWVPYPGLGSQFISVTYSPYVEHDGTVSAVVGSLRNITTVKQAEEALRQSTEQLQMAFEASGDGFWDWNISTNEVYLSPRYFEMLGYGANELPSSLETWQNLVHPKDLPWVKDILAAHFKNSSVRYGFDYRLRTKSGDWKWIADYGKVVAWDEQGNPTRMLGTHRDINDRKQAEIALQASEERWQLALRGNNDGIWDWNIKTNEAFFSSRWKEMLGYENHEISNGIVEWSKRIHPDDRDRIMQLTQDHLTQKTPFYAAEYRFQAKDGSYIWILDRGQALWDETGNPVRMIGSHTDISDRKISEEALRQSESTLRSFFNSGSTLMGIVEVHDMDILHISDNQAAATFFGTTPETMRGRFASEMGVPQPHIQQWINYYREAQRTQAPVRFEYPHRTETHDYWLLASVCHISDDFGKFPRFSYMVEDMSDRKHAENALRASEAKFRSLSEFSPLGIFLTDAAERCTYVNPRYQEITGGSAVSTLGKSWITLLHPDDQAPVTQQWAIAVEQRQDVFFYKVRYLHSDGSIRYVKVYTSPIKTADDAVLGYVGTLEDLTQQHAVEQMKRDFISVVSHELRTPLTAIHGSLGLLSGGVYDNKPEKRQAMLNIAASQTERLVRLVNDILDLSRLESGIIKLVMQPCDPASLIQQSVDGLKAYAIQHQITLSVSSTHAPVWAAPDSIVQTLTNLIGNAIKFSQPQTTVLVSAEQVDSAKTAAVNEGDRLGAYPPRGLPASYILFKVQDCGRGIPDDKLDAIFEQFQQVDASDSREKGGTGLGLAICRNIVHLHGGQIWVNSVLGEGSTFYFTLRLPPDCSEDDVNTDKSPGHEQATDFGN